MKSQPGLAWAMAGLSLFLFGGYLGMSLGQPIMDTRTEALVVAIYSILAAIYFRLPLEKD